MGEHTFLRGPADWWRAAVVYQVYPRSFADANSDSLGDLAGLISKADYLKQLGVDAVWLSPFYPSELADGGYDVADYRNVDPRIGTLDEFDQLVDELHNRDIRVIIDIVPNHTSNKHPWFQEALKSPPGSAARERYIFREGRGDDGEIPPSDLVSWFSPSGWERVPDGQWYLHIFAKEQPDLNWDSPEVRDDFEQTIEFWCERGVDGFRVDVASGLVKQLDPLPVRDSYKYEALAPNGTDALFDRDGVHEIYRGWRKILNRYSPPRIAIAEALVHPERRFAYVAPDNLGQLFSFEIAMANWDSEEYKKVILENLDFDARSGNSSTWVLSNHDVIRHATRLALPKDIDQDSWYVNKRFNPELDAELGLDRARAATLLLLALPGSMYLYQGEELGLPEVLDIPDDQMQDPAWYRGQGRFKSRDGCRVPLPWNVTGKSFGFGNNGSHLPQPKWFGEFSVENQNTDPNSTLNLYRQAISLRKAFSAENSLSWLNLGHEALGFSRGENLLVVTNFGNGPISVPDGDNLISSKPIENGLLAGNSTAWIRSRG